MNANKCLASLRSSPPRRSAPASPRSARRASDFEVQGTQGLDGVSDREDLHHPALSMVVSPLGAPQVKGAVLSLKPDDPRMRCADRVVWYNNGLKTEETRCRCCPDLGCRSGCQSWPVLMATSALRTCRQSHWAARACITLGLSWVLPLAQRLAHRGLRYHAAVSKVADDIAQAVDDAPTVLDFCQRHVGSRLARWV